MSRKQWKEYPSCEGPRVQQQALTGGRQQKFCLSEAVVWRAGNLPNFFQSEELSLFQSM